MGACALSTVLIVLGAALSSCSPDRTDDPATSTSSAPADGSAAPAGAEPPAAPPADAEDPPADGPLISSTKVAQLPTMITALTATPGSDEMLVADRRGVIRRLVRTEVDGYTVPIVEQGAVLDLSDQVTVQFDRGFLNMELVDGGKSIVALYVGLEGELRLEQYPYEPGEAIDPASVRVLADLDWKYPFHHGGGLALDADGDLLVGLGDKGVSLPGVPGPQDPELFIGGVDTIPAEVLADPSRPWEPNGSRMIARGLRNPWRVSADPETGDVYIGDVGNLDFEEVDVVPGSTSDQLNFGHPYFEGPKQLYFEVPDGLDLRDAALARERADDACGVVAGHVYRGGLIDGLEGRFVYTDLCSSEVRSFVLDDDHTARDDGAVGTFPEPVVSFGRGPNGELYGLGYLGGIYRFDPSWWTPPGNEQTSTDPPTPDPPEPADAADCAGIETLFQAIEPLDQIAGFSPAQLEGDFTEANEVLAAKVPDLPPNIRPAGETIRDIFDELSALLAANGWDMQSSALEAYRNEILFAEGPFEGLPDAIVAMSDSGCAMG
jgi:glucose/arabinose dehydrogenase